MRRLDIETVRKELNELLDSSSIQGKHLANQLGWDYTNFSKFRTGKFNYGQEKVNQLGELVRKYDEALKSINH